MVVIGGAVEIGPQVPGRCRPARMFQRCERRSRQLGGARRTVFVPLGVDVLAFLVDVRPGTATDEYPPVEVRSEPLTGREAGKAGPEDLAVATDLDTRAGVATWAAKLTLPTPLTSARSADQPVRSRPAKPDL
jgi:hypothetical protein